MTTLPSEPAPAANPPTPAWDTERQLISALSKLQSLESMIHQLRTLLPNRLLAPIAPIVQPRKTRDSDGDLPSSPQVLYQQLCQSARAAVNELNEFQTMWRSSEMQGIWEHVEGAIREGGQLLQPTGMWEVDYGDMLERILKEEKAREEEERQKQEEEEREVLKTSGSDWRAVVEEFMGRNVPGVSVRVLSGVDDKEASLVAILVKAGMAFQIHAAPVPGEDQGDVPNWRVGIKQSPGKPVTKLETAIVDCLSARARLWDLTYLLEMISSYSEIKTTPCKTCSQMTDSSAQLPSIRVPRSVVTDGKRVFSFDPFHSSCV